MATKPTAPEVATPVDPKALEAEAFAAVKAEALAEGKTVLEIANAIRVDH